jgi:hypothetical protein
MSSVIVFRMLYFVVYDWLLELHAHIHPLDTRFQSISPVLPVLLQRMKMLLHHILLHSFLSHILPLFSSIVSFALCFSSLPLTLCLQLLFQNNEVACNKKKSERGRREISAMGKGMGKKKKGAAHLFPTSSSKDDDDVAPFTWTAKYDFNVLLSAAFLFLFSSSCPSSSPVSSVSFYAPLPSFCFKSNAPRAVCPIPSSNDLCRYSHSCAAAAEHNFDVRRSLSHFCRLFATSSS